MVDKLPHQLDAVDPLILGKRSATPFSQYVFILQKNYTMDLAYRLRPCQEGV